MCGCVCVDNDKVDKYIQKKICIHLHIHGTKLINVIFCYEDNQIITHLQNPQYL